MQRMSRIQRIHRAWIGYQPPDFFYNILGFGFLEPLYGMVLERKLLARHRVAREVGIRVMV